MSSVRRLRFVDNSEMPEMLKVYNEIIDFNAASVKIKAKKAEQERVTKEADDKKKAKQNLSSKNKSMVQSQGDYLRLHSTAGRVWSIREKWITEKPINPPVDTIGGSYHKKSMDKWNYEGGEVRSKMKSIIKSIRGVITDYFNQFNSDIRDDIEDGDISGGGGSASGGNTNENTTEINGP